jgi:hypothetical protein
MQFYTNQTQIIYNQVKRAYLEQVQAELELELEQDQQEQTQQQQ